MAKVYVCIYTWLNFRFLKRKSPLSFCRNLINYNLNFTIVLNNAHFQNTRQIYAHIYTHIHIHTIYMYSYLCIRVYINMLFYFLDFRENPSDEFLVPKKCAVKNKVVLQIKNQLKLNFWTLKTCMLYYAFQLSLN